MTAYDQIKNKLDEIAGVITRARIAIVNGRASISRSQTDLTNLPTKYSGIIADINQMAIDNPGEQIYQIAKDEKDELVTNYQDLKNYADNLLSALDAVSE